MNELNSSKSKIDNNLISMEDHSSLSSSLSPSFHPSSPLINVLLNYSYKNEDINTNFPLKNAERKPNYTTTFSAKLPQFLNTSNTIRIPNKVVTDLKYIPIRSLRKIHPDIEIAKEYCLLYLRPFNSTYYNGIGNKSYKGWEALHAAYLQKFFSSSAFTYKHIREALESPLIRGAILECDYIYEKGQKCFHYRLGYKYRNKGIGTYELKTAEAINLLAKNNKRLFQNTIENPICQNLLHFYPLITLPTIDEIHVEARRLIKDKYYSKKGKKLVYLNKHKRNNDKFSYVEDDIKMYLNLTENGLRIPIPGGKRSGGRVVDSLTLMPSWIRSIIKIGDARLDECDYNCFHPNIVDAIYGLNKGGITHKALALKHGLDEKTVKREHLSFFNKPYYQMIMSPLFEGYKNEYPEMMKKLINEKFESIYEHKATSRKLFEKEVKIMSEVITQLNRERVYVGYVYDALLCHPKHTKRVIEVMNEAALKQGVKTIAKTA